ncbi:MAG: hypothetical protein ISQ27_02155 [PS1 clade bacterium]|nr:hypothetical protein [PS1 clade bacterium]
MLVMACGALSDKDPSIEAKQSDLLDKQSVYDTENQVLNEMDLRHAKARSLLLREFKIANESLLHQFLAELRQQFNETQPETILGLSQNTDLNVLAMFGRNELAKADEYVDLKKSFNFVGGNVSTGISLGRMDWLAKEFGSRNLTVNFAGARLPTVLKSLARTISMPLYLSPEVEAAKQRVRLEVSDVDVLDIFDVIIGNYGLVLAYDRKVSVARFYTLKEFIERLAAAVDIAEQHNKRARNLRKITSLESDEAAIRQIYIDYFQQPLEVESRKSLANVALEVTDYSPVVSKAIISFKQATLANEQALAEMDHKHSAERRAQTKVVREAWFMLKKSKAQASGG